MVKLITVFIMLVFSSFANAATYYVDYVGGNDGSSGLTNEVAWKHCPGDTASTGTPSATVLTAGDVVIFKGGVTYTGTGTGTLITVSQSGISGSPITYRSAVAGDSFGTGRAIIDCNATYYRAFRASAKNYVTIKGFEIINGKNPYSTASLAAGSCSAGYARVTRDGTDQCVQYSGSNLTTDRGTIYITNCNTVIIDDNVIHQAENWSDLSCLGAESDSDVSTVAPNAIANGYGINLYGSNQNITLQNNEIYAAGRFAIAVYRGSNINILNNNIGGGSGAGSQKGYFAVAISLQHGVSNVTISGNRIHDGWQYQGDDAQIRGHSGNMIHIYGNNNNVLEADSDPNNITISGNFFYCDKVFSYAYGTGLSQIEDDSFDITWKNNIIINIWGKGISIPEASNVKILNNTFVSYDAGGSGQALLYFGSELDCAYTRHTIKNNILYQMVANTSVTAVYIDSTDIPAANTPVMDNNLYYNSVSASRDVRYGSRNYSLASWKTYAAAGLQSQDASSVYGDPLFSNLPADGSTSSSGVYSLLTSSPAKDVGATLTDVTSDYDSIYRPQGSAYDIGAYEYYGVDTETTTSSVAATTTTTSITTLDAPSNFQIRLGQ